MRPSRILLLDLDGVLAFEREDAAAGSAQILRLHRDVAERLAVLAIPVVVLTHRSRAEARTILRSVGLGPEQLLTVMAAEDLAASALQSGAWISIFRHGLRKRLIFFRLQKRYGVQPDAMAMIDDRMENLDDLLDAGLGLALHAPSALDARGVLTSFDLDHAFARLEAWRDGAEGPRLISLPPVVGPIAPWQSTGLSTQRDSRHLFNRARTLFRTVRQRAAPGAKPKAPEPKASEP